MFADLKRRDFVGGVEAEQAWGVFGIDAFEFDFKDGAGVGGLSDGGQDIGQGRVGQRACGEVTACEFSFGGDGIDVAAFKDVTAAILLQAELAVGADIVTGEKVGIVDIAFNIDLSDISPGADNRIQEVMGL